MGGCLFQGEWFGGGGGADQLRDRLFRLARLEALKVHGVQA